jgi:hypothetical protein
MVVKTEIPVQLARRLSLISLRSGATITAANSCAAAGRQGVRPSAAD